jgi:hypothetical protein
MAYLRVEKPRFLFLGGSAGDEATADTATVASLDASTARTGTSVVCAASSVDRPPAGAPAPAPGTRSSAASAALGEGGVGSHLSGGACPPSLSSSSSSSDDEYSGVAGGREPLLLAQPELFVPLFPAFSPPDRPFILARRPLLFPSLRRSRARSISGCGRVGPRSVHGLPLLGRTKRQSHGGTWQKNKGKGEESTH